MRIKLITRAIVDSTELRRVMTAALQAMEDDYKDCQFSGITKLQKPDESGCNWSEPKIRCSGIPRAVCKAAATIVIKDFQAEYNIE